MDRARHPRPTDGFTLIETLLVIAIIAMVVSGATLGLGAITRSRIKGASMKVASAATFAYNRSLTHGTTTRLLFNFEKNTMSVEETEIQVTLGTESLFEEESGEAVDPWDIARQRLEKPLEPIEPISPFGPITNDSGTVLKRYQPRPIGDGVAIHQLITPHEVEPRTNGSGSVYFFPGGHTEHAVVQLSDRNDTVYSVELHPLTGRSRVHPFAYEPVTLLDSESEVRDDL